MSELIERQAAIDALAKHEKSNGHNYTLFVDIVSECAEIIRDLPSAQSETCAYWDRESNFCALHRPSAQQKWKIYDILDYAQRPTGRKVAKCPFCDYLTDDFRTTEQGRKKLTNYCPNCGADMRNERREENEKG